jgi:hypothetical protein
VRNRDSATDLPRAASLSRLFGGTDLITDEPPKRFSNRVFNHYALTLK